MRIQCGRSLRPVVLGATARRLDRGSGARLPPPRRSGGLAAWPGLLRPRRQRRVAPAGGLSGSSGGCRKQQFDVVVAESLDRLSRDQEHVAALFKQLSFHGVTLLTIGDSEISELHVGLKGAMSALYLKDLAQKDPARAGGTSARRPLGGRPVLRLSDRARLGGRAEHGRARDRSFRGQYRARHLHGLRGRQGPARHCD